MNAYQANTGGMFLGRTWPYHHVRKPVEIPSRHWDVWGSFRVRGINSKKD